MSKGIATLKDKFAITGELILVTGMHIGASSDFSPIGAVDSVVVRDPLSRKPIIPGSSFKGKMRTLLVKSDTNSPSLPDFNEDSEQIGKLFGTSDHRELGIYPARLQFFDLFMVNSEDFQDKTDLYLTEIKFENKINRKTSVATPRQMERVPAGAIFRINLIYNLEKMEDSGDSQVMNDFKAILKGLKLLQVDYLGGSGTRGYGKVNIRNLKVTAKNINTGDNSQLADTLTGILKEAENFALLPV